MLVFTAFTLSAKTAPITFPHVTLYIQNPSGVMPPKFYAFSMLCIPLFHLCYAALPFTNVTVTDNVVQVQHQQNVCKISLFQSSIKEVLECMSLNSTLIYIYMYHCNFIQLLPFYNYMFSTLSAACPLTCLKQLPIGWQLSEKLGDCKLANGSTLSSVGRLV